MNTSQVEPARQGQSWTSDEEQHMLKRLSAGVSTKDIAQELGRTIGGIVARQKHIARKLVRSGKTIEEVAMLTNLSPKVIRESLDASDTQRVIKEDARTLRKMAGNSADETLLSVVIEIRDLLRQLVNPPIAIPTVDSGRRNSVTIKL